MKHTEVTEIPQELKDWNVKIRKLALEYGLDFFEMAFEMCSPKAMTLMAAYEGFPVRYKHWRFGKQYNDFMVQKKFGMGKIYELVINNDPSYAYLLDTNTLMEQKLVMAHVYGHSDFFKNNMWFSKTNRDMLNLMATHAKVINRYIKKYGANKVETFIDQVLSIDNLISFQELNRMNEDSIDSHNKKLEEELEKERDKESHNYLTSFLNSRSSNKEESPPIKDDMINKIKKPKRDIMKFLMEEAPIEDWKKDIISMLREEAYYFLPQRMTKIMNEGWASYWHSKMMTENLLECDEMVDYASLHSSVVYMDNQSLNPYKVGIELFKDIEERWNKGQFGPEYESCRNRYELDNWDKKLNLGRKKIFEVRKTHNDITFIDTFFTEEFCKKQKLFLYDRDPHTGELVESSRDFNAIKNQLLDSLTNAGSPVIEAVNSNYQNQNELYLKHEHFGKDLDENYANQTLKNIYNIWTRPVCLETKKEGNVVLLRYDDKGLTRRELPDF